MTKIVIVPISSSDEISMFGSTVIHGVNMNLLQPVLFIKLYELLQGVHRNSHFPIWGVASGERSSEANKWNRIDENDLVLFVRDDNFIGYAIVKAKFQSENVARELWPNLQNSEIRQYLLTFEKYVEIDGLTNLTLRSIFQKSKLVLDSFQLIDNNFSSKVINAIVFEEPRALAPSTQGFGLTAAEKKIIELHAVKLAIEHLSTLGFTEIEDVGDQESFDLRAFSPERQISVEVKGSTGPASSVVLTRNEVDFQRKAYPLNGLFVVSNIQLIGEEGVFAQGGEIKFLTPWLIVESSLKVISYEYQV
jgi:hypothetical protein